MTTNNGVEALNRQLKHTYRRLSGCGSLADTLYTVTQEFVPDMLGSYIQSNYTSSEQYRLYSPDVPEYLRNRPKDFVIHCMKRLHAAQKDFKDGDVHQVSDQVFEVKSQDPTRNIWYNCFLGSDTQLPFCECEDFVRSFKLCKHIFAILHFTEKSWTNISPLYTQSCFLTLDSGLLGNLAMISDFDREACTQNQTDADVHSAHEAVHEDTANNTAQDEVVTAENSNQGIEGLRKQLRQQLKFIEDAVYLCTEREILHSAVKSLKSVRDDMMASVTKDTSVPLRPSSNSQCKKSSMSEKVQIVVLSHQEKKKSYFQDPKTAWI